MVEYFATAKHCVFVDANDEIGAELTADQMIASLDCGEMERVEKFLSTIEPEDDGGFTVWYDVAGYYSDYDQDEITDEDPGIDTGDLKGVQWEAWVE